MNGYSTFQGRQRRALGYGMTAKQASELQAIGQDETVKLQAHCKNLFTFTGIYVQHARDLAKSGFKDEARNWHRFFSNAQIIQTLAALKVDSDVIKLREELNFLGLECHPMEPESFTTDIQAIRACLTEILSHVQKSSVKTKTVRQFNPVRHRPVQPRSGRTKRKNFSAA